MKVPLSSHTPGPACRMGGASGRPRPCILLTMLLLAFGLWGRTSAAGRVEPVEVSMDVFFRPNSPEEPYTRQLIDFMRENPDIRIRQWGGISVPAGGKASLMMAIAGQTAPDIGLSWFHIIRNEIEQQFLYPLNEWIGEDLNGNGLIDDDEALWEGWKDVPPLWRQVATVDGKVYGIPVPVRAMTAIIFRTDMAQIAGLDPANPPETWDELHAWCRRLTDPERIVPGAMIQTGQRGIVLPRNGYLFLPWIESAGGMPIVQQRTSPRDERVHTFSMHATEFMTGEGEDLSDVAPVWRANFASPEAMMALDFLHDLRWAPWMLHPRTDRPVPLSSTDLDRGWVEVDGERIVISPDGIIEGVARPAGGHGSSELELLGRGEVAMAVGTVQDLKTVGVQANIDPSLLSWFPVPAAPVPEGRRVVQVYNHFAVLYAGVGDRPREERNAVWRALVGAVDPRVVDRQITANVLEGYSRFVPPAELRRLGYDEYIRDIPGAILRNFEAMESGEVAVITEPYTGFWLLMDYAINRECLSILLGRHGKTFDRHRALRNIEEQANSGLMFETPRAVLDQWRMPARGVMALMVGVMVLLIRKIIRSFAPRKGRASQRQVYSGWLPVLLVLPAVLLITLWRYYPLLRGMVMAFQDYRITGKTAFVGLDNFIILALDPTFWMSLVRTLYFVLLNMLLAFTAPILLAILLTEVPRFKIFFRTLFFLPQMTSSIVIALMWRLMYNPTPAGFFNQVLAGISRIPGIHIEPQTWLSDPGLAMLCVVLPTVWASMGMASLIYLAALHSIPVELYEAAEIDGAGFRQKLLRVTLPSLLPLIIINFVGTFIGTFQNMGNIFLLTFGGPGQATMVVSLRIWIEAYNNLRFSMATAMAWILGSLLIGLTYVQIQFLQKVEYRRAAD